MDKIKYNIQYGVGRTKYMVNFYIGKKHKDGSDFYDIRIFKNKLKMKKFIDLLDKKTLCNCGKNPGFHEIQNNCE